LPLNAPIWNLAYFGGQRKLSGSIVTFNSGATAVKPWSGSQKSINDTTLGWMREQKSSDSQEPEVEKPKWLLNLATCALSHKSKLLLPYY
jgi:hypothetical protein